jgi:hypothetical protein
MILKDNIAKILKKYEHIELTPEQVFEINERIGKEMTKAKRNYMRLNAKSRLDADKIYVD